MAAILKKAWEGYTFMFDELPDQRTKPWFLAAKPFQALTILGLYLMFVLKWGPKFMKGRPAYNLDKILILYNFLQILTCIYIFYNSLVLAWGWDYKWICEPVDFSSNEKALDIAKCTYYYFLVKVVDLIDTVFFVLRKKYRQITFLHIYHHTGMVMLTWAAVTYLPGGHGTLIGVINTFVHIIMYSYYLYTVVNPSAKQSAWWKKYITQLQILQFFWCVVHMATIVFKPDCAYPRWVSAVFLPQNCFILVLFIDFYIKNYIRKSPVQQTANLEKKQSVNHSNGVSQNGYNEEFKILTHALNAVKNDTKSVQVSQVENQSSVIRSRVPHQTVQSGNHRSQSGYRSSQNECHSHENRSRSNGIDKDGKHGKSD